jgi:integrase/recombinase XerD
MTVSKAIVRYREALQIQGSADRTVEAYARALLLLQDFLEAREIHLVTRITEDHLQAFRREVFYRLTRSGEKIGPGRVNVILAAVRGWLRWLHQEGHLARDLRPALPQVRVPVKLPREWLSDWEIERLMASCDVASATGLRDRAILELLYSTGIRNSEACALRIADVDLDNGFLRVRHGKGDKDRVVPLGRVAARWIRTYLERSRPLLAPADSTETLLIGARGRPMTRHTLAYTVKRIGELASLRKRVTPHVIRHTFAAHLLRNNAPLRHIQEMLGHSKLSTTERYLRITIQDLKAAHRAYHPRERGPIDPIPVFREDQDA